MPDADWNDPPQADIAIAGDKIAGQDRARLVGDGQLRD
jgi:hypothetical protein